jgi:uncharacterized DUF497 family protein
MAGEAPGFEWDDAKDRINRTKHGVGFDTAKLAFLDSSRVIAEDVDHGGAAALFLFRPRRWSRDDSTVHLA